MDKRMTFKALQPVEMHIYQWQDMISTKSQREKIQLRHGTVTPALGRVRQENHEFKASLGYTARLCLKTTKARESENSS
jgi:hypothetical protein